MEARHYCEPAMRPQACYFLLLGTMFVLHPEQQTGKGAPCPSEADCQLQFSESGHFFTQCSGQLPAEAERESPLLVLNMKFISTFSIAQC